MTLRHWAAAPNCDAARAIGLAPAAIGEPGYYARHDADHDGVACEPYRAARTEIRREWPDERRRRPGKWDQPPRDSIK
nr:excalibur calcium-binding domain-containing protein [Pikeienuella piscinae]